LHPIQWTLQHEVQLILNLPHVRTWAYPQRSCNLPIPPSSSLHIQTMRPHSKPSNLRDLMPNPQVGCKSLFFTKPLLDGPEPCLLGT
jgi:hypothetical protein